MAALTRRRWLQAISAAVAGSSIRAAEPDSPIRFGFSLYGMKSLSIPAALKACADIGYDGVELALMPGWPADPKKLTDDQRLELRQRLTDSNLALLGLMENLAEPADDAAHRSNLERLKAAAELGHALSPKQPPVIETILGGKPSQWDQVKERLADRLKAWAAVAAAARTVIAIKPHVANALHTPEGAKWLLRQIDSPWIKLAYDYSHLVLRGVPLAESVTALAPHTAFIHVKDAKGTPEKFEFLLPGDGNIDYVEYLKLLRSAAYRGPIVVEVSGQLSNKTGYDPVAAAQRSYRNLAAAFAKAGIGRK
jgi:inosose dehydratase